MSFMDFKKTGVVLHNIKPIWKMIKYCPFKMQKNQDKREKDTS